MYRGIIDKKWLRISPEFIRALCGNVFLPELIMVGQVTNLPRNLISDDKNKETSIIEGNENVSNKDPENPSLRDEYRNVLLMQRIFERIFLESDSKTEVIIYPLAIYSEIQIGVESSDLSN